MGVEETKTSQTQSFVLTQNEMDLIAKKAEKMGSASNSAALRAIVREWEILSAKQSLTVTQE